MKKFAIYIMLILSAVAILSLPIVWGDDDEWGKDEGDIGGQRFQPADSAGIVGRDQYKTECGDCHMAYPPGLLPARSWTKIMKTLDDHFDDNAELDPKVTQNIQQYLEKHSADNTGAGSSRKWIRNIQQNSVPLRISELPYFEHEHDEIGKSMVADNPDVISFSNCNACHRKAEQGSFRERDINIPNHGEWDD